MNYDVIGDIHGHAGALETLLKELGYRERSGAWRQPGHMAIFVGDYIDRGPRQLDTVQIVRSMVDAGAAHAVMGNHEFNAIAWSLPDAEQPGEFMRRHSLANERQHKAFLDATKGRAAEYGETLDWFLSLPLWLELPGLRVVHACWDEDSMSVLAPMLDDQNCIDLDGVVATSRRGTAAFSALECVLKGPEIKLPNGVEFKQGEKMRTEARICWWKPHSTNLREAVLVGPTTVSELPEGSIPDKLWPRFDTSKPIFFGHYWMSGTPELQTARIACLDYSVARGEPLVGYRWRGETDLDPAHFVKAA